MVYRVQLLPLPVEGKSAVMLSGPDLPCCWGCNFLYFLRTAIADKHTRVHAPHWNLERLLCCN